MVTKFIGPKVLSKLAVAKVQLMMDVLSNINKEISHYDDNIVLSVTF